MKILILIASVLLMSQNSMARQLQGQAAVIQEMVAQQLEISKGRVKAWPDGKFKVYESSIGSNDSQRDGVICSGTMEFLQNDVLVVGNLTECLDAVAELRLDKED